MSHTILIVEDHPLVAKFYRMALERAGGYSCWVSEDAEEIVSAVERGGISLVLMDVSLRATQWQGRPIDGIELARLLKQRTPTRLPVILATAHAMTGDRERLLAASGADAYLQKPVYDARELVEMVQQLISQP